MTYSLKKCISVLLLAALLVGMFPVLQGFAAYGNGYAGGMAGEGSGIYAHGVDISEWQGENVDFEKVKAQGYSFVILRAGFATTIDATFEHNYAKAKAAGLHVGVYLYSYADSKEESLAEAEALKGWLKGKTLEYPVYFDLEDPESHEGRGVEELTEISLAFLDSMANDGWLVGLYSSISWLNHKVDTARVCAKYECWMAQYLYSGTYDIYDRYDEVYGMWQYSASGEVDGIDGSVDMNICFKDYPNICKQYGFNGYAATGETLTISGARAPSVLAKGDTFQVVGTINSQSGKLTNVTVGIYDEAGQMVTGRSAGPRTERYEISALAAGVKMQTLPEGKYEYRVIATNTSQTKLLLKQSLHISAAGIRVDGLELPVDLKVGNSFALTGTLTASTELSRVTARVTAADGKERYSATAQPNAQQFDLTALASDMDFRSLDTGSYVLYIEAVSAKGTQVIARHGFSVWVREDPLTLNGLRLEAEYEVGTLTRLDGTISSKTSELQGVRVTIGDSKGKEAARAEHTGGKTKLELSELSGQLDLSELPVGVYVCKIEAVNAAGPKVLAEQSFLLRADTLSLFALCAPSNLVQGDSFAIGGMVASDYSVLEFVGVSVTDAEGKRVLDAAVIPQKNLCDLQELGKKLIFSTLRAGVYRLRITAENDSVFETLYDGTFTVHTAAGFVTWEDGHFALGDTAYFAGDSISLWGTLCSPDTDLTCVSAQICNEDGLLVTEAKNRDLGKVFSIYELNQRLHFSALSEGAYVIRILAETENGSYLMCEESFRITDCPHVHTHTGTLWAAHCTARGAVCNSRCLDCGEDVQSGVVIACTAHSYQNGNCSQCGRAPYQTVTVQKAQAMPKPTGRYVLTVEKNGQWYALGSTGETVQISAPGRDGKISLSASLLWAPSDKRGNVMCFENPQGARLHFDSSGLCIAAGGVNAALLLEVTESAALLLRRSDDPTRCLSFENAEFGVGSQPCEIVIWEYVP